MENKMKYVQPTHKDRSAKALSRSNDKILRYCQKSYASPPVELLERFNNIVKDANLQLHYEDIYPCFFTGDVDLKDPFLSVSINPAYGKQTKKEQGDCLEEWMERCKHRFKDYPSDKAVHTVFKYTLKVFLDPSTIRLEGVRQSLQRHVVNLDWCPFFSSNWKTVSDSFLGKRDLMGLRDYFDENLRFLIGCLKPARIFLHGSQLEHFARGIIPRPRIKLLRHGEREYEVLYGRTVESIPVVYQRPFINRANKTLNLEIIRGLFEQA
jgi:hypothetical protein